MNTTTISPFTIHSSPIQPCVSNLPVFEPLRMPRGTFGPARSTKRKSRAGADTRTTPTRVVHIPLDEIRIADERPPQEIARGLHANAMVRVMPPSAPDEPCLASRECDGNGDFRIGGRGYCEMHYEAIQVAVDKLYDELIGDGPVAPLHQFIELGKILGCHKSWDTHQWVLEARRRGVRTLVTTPRAARPPRAAFQFQGSYRRLSVVLPEIEPVEVA